MTNSPLDDSEDISEGFQQSPRPSAYTQSDLRHYITGLGAVLLVFGLLSALIGHASAIPASPAPGVEPGNAADAWMWIGILALVAGLSVLIVQIFLHAYGKTGRVR